MDERTGLSAIAIGNAPAVPDVRLARRGAADYDPEGDAGDAGAEQVRRELMPVAEQAALPARIFPPFASARD